MLFQSDSFALAGGVIQAAVGMGFRQGRMPLNRLGVTSNAAFSVAALPAWPALAHSARCGVSCDQCPSGSAGCWDLTEVGINWSQTPIKSEALSKRVN